MRWSYRFTKLLTTPKSFTEQMFLDAATHKHTQKEKLFMFQETLH